MKKEKNATLLALSSTTLLLPAYQAVHADVPPDRTQMGVRYSEYEEDRKKRLGAEADRPHRIKYRRLDA